MTYRTIETLNFRRNETFLVRANYYKHKSPQTDYTEKVIPNKLLGHFSKIRIRFIQSPGVTVLGFSKIKLFVDSRNKTMKEKIEKLLNNKVKESIYGNYSEDASEIPETPKIIFLKTSKTEKPAWLLDSVTHDVMKLPVLLPSGNWVDQSTIVKWRKESKIWSRGLTDPFTGNEINYEPNIDAQKRQKIAEYMLSQK